MNLMIHWNGLPSNDGVEAHLERRLAFALGRFGDEIGEVRAQLADLNGPRGGIDKQVKLLVRGRRLATRLVVAADSNLFAAIDRACDRIQLAVARALDRRQRGFRQGSACQAK